MPSFVIKDPALGTPNGLIYDARHKRLVVACRESGEILAVNLRNKQVLIPSLKGNIVCTLPLN